jgi:hypothetical protein
MTFHLLWTWICVPATWLLEIMIICVPATLLEIMQQLNFTSSSDNLNQLEPINPALYFKANWLARKRYNGNVNFVLIVWQHKQVDYSQIHWNTILPITSITRLVMEGSIWFCCQPQWSPEQLPYAQASGHCIQGIRPKYKISGISQSRTDVQVVPVTDSEPTLWKHHSEPFLVMRSWELVFNNHNFVY